MTDFDSIKPGLEAERTITIEEKHTVAHTGVPVLGTPMMVGLIEMVSKDLVQPLLPPGFTTVGYEVSIKHKAPAFLGDAVRVAARVLEADGRKLRFEVRVTLGEKVIGEGTHRRTVIPLAA